jgi:uncharacterized protein (DUF736 family)
LEVEDLVSAPEVPATARYHLAPAFRLQLIGHRVWQVMAGGEPWARVEVMHGRGSLEVSTFAPEFGVVLLTQCLAVDCEGGRALTRWTWHETDPKMSTCTSSF